MDPESVEQSKLKWERYLPLPSWAHAFAALGPTTESVINKHFEERLPYHDVFGRYGTDNLKRFADALGKWTDDRAIAVLVSKILQLADQGLGLDVSAIARWTLLHPDDPEGVMDCLEVEPPPEIEIIRVLSRAGSQKVVFEATWRLTQRKVVLKRLAENTSDTVLAHEASSHPLSISNPTIIETHLMRNARNETFLVERWLPEVLNDSWVCDGVQQAANLVYCLADAVSVVHSLDRVHGDIKPDNIGKEGDLFILLDFGICRRTAEFNKDTTGTGSLRTRAPELLLNDAYLEDPRTVDIWAIGATLFNFLVGRFPFIDRNEEVPRISHPEERSSFEKELERRVREEWKQRVTVQNIPEQIRPIIERCLEANAERRPSASELKQLVEKHLSVFLRRELKSGRFAPLDELAQFEAYLPPPDILAKVPADVRTNWKQTVEKLRETPGFNDAQLQRISILQERLNA